MKAAGLVVVEGVAYQAPISFATLIGTVEKLGCRLHQSRQPGELLEVPQEEKRSV